MKYIFPQEIEVMYILPAIRKYLAMELKKLNLDQKTIAKKLSVTEAAVSQYINSKRANEVQFSSKIKQAIKNSAKIINDSKIDDYNNLIKETEKLLKLAREEKITCNLHKKLSNIHKNCNACFNCKK